MIVIVGWYSDRHVIIMKRVRLVNFAPSSLRLDAKPIRNGKVEAQCIRQHPHRTIAQHRGAF